MNPGELYARILRAASRGRGVRLTAEECDLFWLDDASTMAAIGGDDDAYGEVGPPWLTPAERRRWRESGDPRHVFDPPEDP